ncbi:interferon gamma [Aulostomus maculatus]
MVLPARAVVCMSLWLCVCQARGSHVPQKMNRTIMNLLEHYKISNGERFNGPPVFSREFLTGKTEANQVFMVGVLEAYEKLLGTMLQQQPTPSPQAAAAGAIGSSDITAEPRASGDVRTDLSYILKMVKELKTHHYLKQRRLLKGLRDLDHIQNDNLLVQSKALWELIWLYEVASSLPNQVVERQRQRRQAKRVKPFLRG